MSQTTTVTEVLTLNEAAGFLRLSPETVERQAAQGNIPGQLVEGCWRFLHAALEDWLRIRGFKHLAKVITGVVFKDGIEQSNDSTVAA